MRFCLLAVSLLFSAVAFARPDQARLNGNPLPRVDLELASILLDRRGEVTKLYADTNGVEIRFQRGAVHSRLEDSALITVYTLKTFQCPRAETCEPLDTLVLEKRVTQGRQELVTSFLPLVRRQGEIFGRRLSDETVAIASIFVNQRAALSAHYDTPGYGDAGLWLARGTENVQRSRSRRDEPSTEPLVITTTYEFEVEMRGPGSPDPESGYWTDTLTITEVETHGPSGTTKSYQLRFRGSGLG